MTSLKRQAFSIIENVPDESMEFFLQIMIGAQNLIVARRDREEKQDMTNELDALFAKEPPLTNEQRKKGQILMDRSSRAFEVLNELFKDNKGWDSEEAMIEELSRERRELIGP